MTLRVFISYTVSPFYTLKFYFVNLELSHIIHSILCSYLTPPHK